MARARSYDAGGITLVGIAALAVLGTILWLTVKIVLVLFASVLLAVFLRGIADWLAAQTGLGEGMALALVGGAILAILATTAALLAPEVSAQLDQLTDTVPRAWADLITRITRYEWGRRLVSTGPNPSESAALVANAGVLLAATIGNLAHFVVFLLAGIYLAVDPRPYIAGVLWCVPRERRKDTAVLVDRVGRLLRWWLLSRLVAMSVVGVLTTLGLWALGMPLALTLGLAAGIMTFVPYVGAFASAAPALLLGFVQSPVLAGYVVLLYVGVHLLEGYLITPLIEQEAIRLPPALSIASQAILGTTLGPLGLALASPLTASALVVAHTLAADRERAKAA